MFLKGYKQTPEHTAKIHTPERAHKISLTMRGKKKPPLSLEHRQKISKAQLGKRLSEETKHKMRESHKGKNYRGLGWHHTEEWRKK